MDSINNVHIIIDKTALTKTTIWAGACQNAKTMHGIACRNMYLIDSVNLDKCENLPFVSSDLYQAYNHNVSWEINTNSVNPNVIHVALEYVFVRQKSRRHSTINPINQRIIPNSLLSFTFIPTSLYHI